MRYFQFQYRKAIRKQRFVETCSESNFSTKPNIKKSLKDLFRAVSDFDLVEDNVALTKDNGSLSKIISRKKSLESIVLSSRVGSSRESG
ncbi:hypothetical protein HZH68_005250 [Vespula germanica]|uniref:Uncharacterized protein n=1 Tax=Vespula germanica TaxID=30212 RepID=A0A834KHD1_VESGE|nr:hypothetical protein HZH68_005250 [Vespula germanica]